MYGKGRPLPPTASGVMEKSGAELGHGIEHVGLGVGESVENGEQALLIGTVELLNVILGGGGAVHALPRGGNAVHLEHGTDVVDLEHAHGGTSLLHGGLHPRRLERLDERLNGSEAPEVDRRAGPIENNCLYHR